MENSAVTERRDYFTYTVFIFTNSLIPIGESSRPYPLILIPLKGNRGSDRTYSFTKQQPASSFSASIFRPLSTSFVKIAAPRPYLESLASLIAWSSLPAVMIAATGPKIASSTARLPFFHPVTIVWHYH